MIGGDIWEFGGETLSLFDDSLVVAPGQKFRTAR